MRRILFFLILIAGVYYLYAHLADLEAVADSMAKGNWQYLLLAFVVQIIWLVSLAVTFRAAQRLVGIDQPLGAMLLQTLAALFVNTVTATGGLGGAGIYVAEARRKGFPAARVTLGAVVWVLFEYASVLVFLSAGFAALLRRGRLTITEITAAAVILAASLMIGAMLYTGMRSEALLARLLTSTASLLNRAARVFLKRDPFSLDYARMFAHEASAGLGEIRNNLTKLAWPAGMALSSKALMLTLFYLCFRAFEVPASTGTVIAGFGLSYLFSIVSPTPTGVGIVEGVLPLALASMFVPFGAAAAITLCYRGLTFWLPLVYGLVALRLLEHQRQKSAGLEENSKQ